MLTVFRFWVASPACWVKGASFNLFHKQLEVYNPIFDIAKRHLSRASLQGPQNFKFSIPSRSFNTLSNKFGHFFTNFFRRTEQPSRLKMDPLWLKAEFDLDLSPAGLFPDNESATQDAKCVVISKLFTELSRRLETTYKIAKYINQETLREEAAKRYNFLSEKDRLPLHEADNLALQLRLRGATEETAKEYASFRLSEKDAKM